MPFAYPSRFDRRLFGEDVARSLEDRGPTTDLDAYLRDAGVRYIVEAPQLTIDDVRNLVHEVVHEAFEVERLFDPDLAPVPDRLRGFYLVRLRGVLPHALTQSPYEPAYALRAASTSVHDVEPDLPYAVFATTSTTYAIPPHGPTTAGSIADKAWSLRNIRADAAWSLFGAAEGGEGVSIAHLDTGWTVHDDLDFGRIDLTRAKDFVDPGRDAHDPLMYYGQPGHGTRTASVILSGGGVVPGPGTGTTAPGQVTGVARAAICVPVRCIKSVVIIFNGDVARGIHYATGTATACHVVSMSLGGRPMTALEHALAAAVQADLIVVAAAGNHAFGVVVWPARYPDAISIAASNFGDGPWSGSSRGAHVDLAAPGEDVWKADPDPLGQAASIGSGTSYATANVAGAAALWLSYFGVARLAAVARHNRLSLQEVFRHCLRVAARVPPGWDSRYGTGILDAWQMLVNNPGIAFGGRATRVHPLLDLLDDESPEVGAEFLATALGIADVGRFVEAFGHEFVNLMLDDTRVRNEIQRAGRSHRELPPQSRHDLLARASALLKTALER